MPDHPDSPSPSPKHSPETPPPREFPGAKFPPPPVRDSSEHDSTDFHRRQNSTVRFIAWTFALVLLLLVLAWAIQSLI